MSKIDITKFKEHDIKTLSGLHNLLQYNPIFIDVRSKKEYCDGHICGSINIDTPLPPLTLNEIKKIETKLIKLKINKNATILVYCKVGKRAGLAKKILKILGYNNVSSLGGVDYEPLKSLILGIKKDKYIQICYCNKQ